MIWLVVGLLVLAWLALTRLGKITGVQARALVANGARLVDVRSPAEFAGGHLPGAENVPLDVLGTRAAGWAAEARPVVVYCASGVRSASAKRALRAAGVGAVHDLGALGRW